MPDLTTLGAVHTTISLVASASGAVALVRDREIASRNRIGKVYVMTTLVASATGLAIVHQGVLDRPHALGVATLFALAAAGAAEHTQLFGGAGRYVQTVTYSATFLFHCIAGLVETTTRLPRGAPLFSHPDALGLHACLAVLFALYLAGAALQVRRLRASKPALRGGL